ncbi:MAG TPA: murein biosynthesis integral membrane protein MurJ [Thermoanaerobaculia bacterium]|nr:murein biosynthesis integral membrane protein MurJ [Thermoanaerobaculia bacterium]
MTDHRERRPFGGHAALVAAGILLSRIAGLIRTRVFAHFLGSSRAADAFNVALKVPNFLQNLLGEGVLSASFIPVYARLLARGDERLAGRVAGVFATLLMLGLSGIVLLGVLLAPWILQITAPGFPPDVMRLTVTLVRIIFPGVGLLVLSAWCLGVLNTHRQFFLSYVAPVLWNAAMIATLVIFGTRLRERELAVALAWGTLIGCALQLGIQMPFVFRHARQLSFGIDRDLAPVREIFRNLAPVIGGRGVVQISGYVDQFIATFLPAGAVANLVYAQTVYLLPISVFGMSVSAAELPQMSAQSGTKEEIDAALRARLTRGLRQISFFIVPTAVAFLLIGRLLVAALYQTGKFTNDVTLVVWYVLAGWTTGLVAATLGRLYSSAFYALQDTRTPFRFALARVSLGATLALLLAFPFRGLFATAIRAASLPMPHLPGGADALAVIGIPLASGVASWVEFLLLRRALRRRIGAGEPAAGFLARLWTSALVAGGASLAFDLLVARDAAAHLPLRHINEALMVCLVFGVVYFATAFLLGVPEVKSTLARFRR